MAGPEPCLLPPDEIHVRASFVRCERGSQRQVLDSVGRISGAIDYPELRKASDAARCQGLRVLSMEGRKSGASADLGRYLFVVSEVFYSASPPPDA